MRLFFCPDGETDFNSHNHQTNNTNHKIQYLIVIHVVYLLNIRFGGDTSM